MESGNRMAGVNQHLPVEKGGRPPTSKPFKTTLTLARQTAELLDQEFVQKGRLGTSVTEVVEKMVLIYLTERGYQR